MEIRTIQTFHSVVDFGNFQKAAEKLNYSQPTITFRIKQLERDLGIKLFERGKVLKLTHDGRLFYHRSKKLLQDYQKLDSEIEQLRLGTIGSIRIGISEPTASLKFPEVLSNFIDIYPNILVDVFIEDANTCSQMLEKGEIDFAICGEPEIKLENYYEAFFHDKLVLLVSENNPLAEQQEVSLVDLKEERFIFTPVNCPIRIQIEQTLQKKIGSSYKKMIVTKSAAHKYYVQQNIGVSIFTETANLHSIEHTKVIPITDIDIHPPVGILTSEKHQVCSNAAQELILKIKDSFLKQ
ncbi:LysR family transcriptional regulator [Terrilactibacillus sp. BCM23-1]|uniref:LysR family transcriptional regulator n=1 Tax=Terrilactibacillus tamarindi TaxID=2599694 RepID=A0A6N8CRQ7_9BACI|nr:LysR family transcriptional regulator [Terrilactibacillus tamarindi]MTT32350.1 LysR family transcriptional regulator [Terrilactibacillus tamarindi]